MGTLRVRVREAGALAGALLALAAAPGCAAGGQSTQPGQAQYVPQTRSSVVTIVPLLVQEMQNTLPFLQQEFATGGLLDGKEVFAFYPSTLTVYQGDMVQIALTNASADDHTFTVPDLAVNVSITEQSSATASFAATKPGVFTFVCSVPEHTPYMRGEIVVLPQ